MVYEGAAFPEWKGDLFVGSLMDQTVYWIRPKFGPDGGLQVKAGCVAELISGLARVRDIEVDRGGEILLLLENNREWMVVRIRNAD